MNPVTPYKNNLITTTMMIFIFWQIMINCYSPVYRLANIVSYLIIAEHPCHKPQSLNLAHC